MPWTRGAHSEQPRAKATGRARRGPASEATKGRPRRCPGRPREQQSQSARRSGQETPKPPRPPNTKKAALAPPGEAAEEERARGRNGRANNPPRRRPRPTTNQTPGAGKAPTSSDQKRHAAPTSTPKRRRGTGRGARPPPPTGQGQNAERTAEPRRKYLCAAEARRAPAGPADGAALPPRQEAHGETGPPFSGGAAGRQAGAPPKTKSATSRPPPGKRARGAYLLKPRSLRGARARGGRSPPKRPPSAASQRRTGKERGPRSLPAAPVAKHRRTVWRSEATGGSEADPAPQRGPLLGVAALHLRRQYPYLIKGQYSVSRWKMARPKSAPQGAISPRCPS